MAEADRPPTDGSADSRAAPPADILVVVAESNELVRSGLSGLLAGGTRCEVLDEVAGLVELDLALLFTDLWHDSYPPQLAASGAVSLLAALLVWRDSGRTLRLYLR